MIGKYTLRERRERIMRYKLKLQKYRQGIAKKRKKYHKRSAIARTKPRDRGKFAKSGSSQLGESTIIQHSQMPGSH